MNGSSKIGILQLSKLASAQNDLIRIKKLGFFTDKDSLVRAVSVRPHKTEFLIVNGDTMVYSTPISELTSTPNIDVDWITIAYIHKTKNK